jgi:hypothetical protein
MTKAMFIDIYHSVARRKRYFQRTQNAAGVPGFTTIQKVAAAVRMLAYGGPADRLDEYIRMGESTILECVNKFTRTIVEEYGDIYLREPNEQDIARLLAVAEQRGFPGEWEKCPTAWHGQYRGHHMKPTIILEAVASYDLWIWHAFFGTPGSCNDVNVLHRSPVFDNLARGSAPEVHFTVNGNEYNMGYYLADGMYPPWATLVSGYSSPQSNKQKRFAEEQSKWRKDVERSFGKMQAKYAITKGPARLWSQEDLKYIIDCVVILNNMGIIYEQGMEELRIEDYENATCANLDTNRDVPTVQELIQRHLEIQSRPSNEQLKNDLIEHVWNMHGST